MERLDDLPVPALLTVLSFLYEDVAAKILKKNRANYCQCVRGFAAVSRRWLSAIEAVDAHFRDSVLVFDFQQATEADTEEKNGTIDHKTLHTSENDVPANDAPSGFVFQLVKGLFSAFACSSSPGTNRPTRRLSEEEELKELTELESKKMQKQRKAKHAENELKRLLEEVTNEKTPRRVGLWLVDPHDVTICDFDHSSGGVSLMRQWGDLFVSCGNLKQLDLSGIPVESDHLPTLLNAVGEQCANLEKLVMPQQTHLMCRRRSVSNMLDAFHAALASLDALAGSRPGRRSGLKNLVLPSLFPNENVDATAEAIGEYCPNLQRIEGLRLAAFSRRRRLTSVEMRQSTLQSWETFCKGCSRLTALNWCSLPCSDEVFHIFALYPKLELKSLVLPGNTALWRRDYILQERHHVEPLSPSNSFAPVLRACPNLTSLKVLLSDMQGDGECLGDQFLRAVADNCPLIESLALVEASVHHGFGPSNAFTSDGLKTLTNLRHLHSIELNGVQVSEKVLLSLAACSQYPNRPRTSVDVTLGVRGWNAIDVAKCFHETILGLLGNLVVVECGEYPAFIIRVRPDTRNFSSTTLWNASYTSEWNRLKRQLKWKAPNIKFYYDYLRAEATIECQEQMKDGV